MPVRLRPRRARARPHERGPRRPRGRCRSPLAESGPDLGQLVQREIRETGRRFSSRARSDSRRRSSAKLSSVSAPVTGSRSSSARATARRSSRARIQAASSPDCAAYGTTSSAPRSNASNIAAGSSAGVRTMAGTESQRSSSRIRSRSSSPSPSPGRRTIRRYPSHVVECLGEARRLDQVVAGLPDGRGHQPPLRLGSAQQQDRGLPVRRRAPVGSSVRAPAEGRRLRSCPTYRCPPGHSLALGNVEAERRPAGRRGRYSAA